MDGSNRTLTYSYDVENRLVTARGLYAANLRYDPLGRLHETVTNVDDGIPANDVTIRRLYDGGALVAEYDQTGTMLRRFVHGPNTGADTPLVWYEGPTMQQSAARMLSTDLQGSVTSVTDFNGNPIALGRYDEYGRPQSGNVGRFQYTGQAWLPEIGLYYYKARMYSPTLGRFMQTDPIGYADGVNWYNYVGGDPVNGVDPTGLYEWFCKKHIVSLGGVDHVGETCGYRPEPGDDLLWRDMPNVRAEYGSGGGEILAGLKDVAKDFCETFIESGGDPNQMLSAAIGAAAGAAGGKFLGDLWDKTLIDKGEKLGRIIGNRSDVIGAGARNAARGVRIGRIGGYVTTAIGAVVGVVYRKEIDSMLQKVKSMTCGQLIR